MYHVYSIIAVYNVYILYNSKLYTYYNNIIAVYYNVFILCDITYLIVIQNAHNIV